MLKYNRWYPTREVIHKLSQYPESHILCKMSNGEILKFDEEGQDVTAMLVEIKLRIPREKREKIIIRKEEFVTTTKTS